MSRPLVSADGQRREALSGERPENAAERRSTEGLSGAFGTDSATDASADRRRRSALGVDDLEMLARPRERMLKPRKLDRLQQIIRSCRVEGLNRVMVDRRDEDDCRENLATRQPPDDVEAVAVAHLDVEQDDVGSQPRDFRQGVFAGCRLAHMLDVTDPPQQELEAPKRERLIIYGQDAKGLH